MKGSEGRREEMDGGQSETMGGESVIVFQDTETERPMGKSTHSRSETFTLCPQTLCFEYEYVHTNVL